MMFNISREKAAERFNALPEHLKEALFSEKNTSVVWGVGEANHLGEEKIQQIASLTGAVILGFIHPEDLANALRTEAGLPQEIASSIAGEINRKVLEPIIEEVKSLYHWGSPAPPPRAGSNEAARQQASPQEPNSPQTPNAAGASPLPPPPPPPPKPGSEPEIEPPIVHRNQPEGESPASPYLLHQQRQAVERVKEPAGGSALMRPYFFEPEGNGETEIEEPTKARLEFGGLEEAAQQLEAKRGGEENVRIVHYSGLNTGGGASNPQTGQNSSGSDATDDVHPDNIVNLKKLSAKDGSAAQ